jgi:hypothetical protein
MMNKRNKFYHLIPNEVIYIQAATPCDTEVLLECHDCHYDVVLCDATSSPLLPDVGMAADVIEDQLNLFTYGNCIINFFYYDKKSDSGESTFLVARAITETPVVVSQLIHPHYICYHMKICKFVKRDVNLHILFHKWQHKYQKNMSTQPSTYSQVYQVRLYSLTMYIK